MSTVKLIRDLFKKNYLVLILDNEVTVKDFVADPPLSWARLILQGGSYIADQGSPTFLTKKKQIKKNSTGTTYPTKTSEPLSS